MSWEEVYQRNKRLDEFFWQKYLDTEPNYFEKNCLELSVEIGEAANASRCFKYWSIKSMNREELLEEIADCIIINLYFFHYLDLKIELLPVGSDTNQVVVLFNQLFQLSSCLMDDCDSQLVKQIFSCLLQLGSLFGFAELELQEACMKKIEKVEKRLQSETY